MTLTPVPLEPASGSIPVSAPVTAPIAADETTPPAASTTSTSTSAATAESEAAAIVSDVEQIAANVASATAEIATPTLWTAIMGFFTALPDLAKLALALMNFLNRISGNNPKAAIATWGQFFSQLASAKTQGDYENAAQKFADSINKLPS
jgi:hypothetical protein